MQGWGSSPDPRNLNEYHHVLTARPAPPSRVESHTVVLHERPWAPDGCRPQLWFRPTESTAACWMDGGPHGGDLCGNCREPGGRIAMWWRKRFPSYSSALQEHSQHGLNGPSMPRDTTSGPRRTEDQSVRQGHGGRRATGWWGGHSPGSPEQSCEGQTPAHRGREGHGLLGTDFQKGHKLRSAGCVGISPPTARETFSLRAIFFINNFQIHF